MVIVVRAFLTLVAVCVTGCSLMAPSDTELMGEVVDAAEDAPKDSSADRPEDWAEASAEDGGACGASGSACTTDTDCCSAKCRGGSCH
jgi:hypothetical protein